MPFSSYLTVEWSPSTAPFATESWENITSKVRTIRTYAGARSIEDVFGAGTCTLEVNNQLKTVPAWLDMNTWYRYRRLRVSTATATLFDGWVKSIVHDPNITNGVSFARIDCVDAVGLVAAAGGDADFETWQGSPADTTIDGVDGYIDEDATFDLLTWLADTINAAITPVSDDAAQAPMFIAAKQTGSGLALLQDYLEAERGQVCASGTTITLFGRYKPFALSAATPTATFSDAGTYRYRDLVLAAPDEAYYDTAVVGVKGSDVPQRTANVPTNYPPSTYTRTTQSPLTDPNWAKANADMIVAIGEQTDTYPRQITAHVAGPTATSVDTSHPALLATLPGDDALNVTYAGTTYKVRPVSIEHNISVERGWWVTYGFSSLDRFAAAYGAVDVFTLGASALGGPDILGP